MKWKILFAVLAVMLLVGCAKPKVEEEPITPPVTIEEPITPPVIEEVIEEPAPVVEEPQVTTETVTIFNNYAEPVDLKITAGSTVVFKSESSRVNMIQVKAVGFNQRSPRLNEGDMWDITLTEPGEYDFLDIIIGRAKGTITVE